MNIVKYLSLALMLSAFGGCEDKKTSEKATQKNDSDNSILEKSLTTEAKKVAAVFPDGIKINVDDVYDQLNLLPEELKSKPFAQLYKALLRRMVDSKILDKAAKDLNIHTDPKILAEIQKNKDLTLQRLFIEDLVKKTLTDQKLKKEYDDLVAKMPKDEKELQLRIILVKTRTEAEDIIKKLQEDPKQFETLVKEHSLDPESKKNGGTLGYVKKTDLPEQLSKILFESKANTVIAQPFEMGQNGFAIFFTGEKRSIEIPKFEQVKAQLSKSLVGKYATEAINELKKQYKVEKFDLKGNPLKDKTPEELEEQIKSGKVDEVDIKKLDKKMVVAKFEDGSTILLQDVIDSLKDLPDQFSQLNFGEIYELLLIKSVDQKIVQNEIKKRKFEQDPIVIKKLDEIEKATIQKEYLEKELSKKITDQMLKDKYQEFLKTYPKNQSEVRLRQIIVKDADQAKQIIADIKSGKKSFDQCVAEYSIDEATKAKKGEIGYVRREQLPKSFADVVFSAPQATMLPEPINLGKVGFSIMRIEDKRLIPVPKFEEVKKGLYDMLKAEKVVDFLNDMRDASTVKVFDIDGKEISIKNSKEEIEALQKTIQQG